MGNGSDNVNAGAGKNSVTVGDNINLGNGNNIVWEGTGYDNVNVGNGDNLIVGGLGRYHIQAGNGRNILIDGSVQMKNNDTLAKVRSEWIIGGASAASTIRASWTVTENANNANTIIAGSGLDWFWFTDSQDSTNKKSTDLLN